MAREQSTQIRESEGEMRDAHKRYVDAIYEALVVERNPTIQVELAERYRLARIAYLDHLKLGARFADTADQTRLADPKYVRSVWIRLREETPPATSSAPVSPERRASIRDLLEEAHQVPQGEKTIDDILVEANAKRAIGDDEDAIALYSLVIEYSRVAKGAVSPEALFGRAMSLTMLERLEEALRDYDAFLAQSPVDTVNRAAALNNRGTILADLGRNDEALDSYDSAILLGDRDGAGRYNRAQLLRALGKYEDAVREVDLLLESHPNNANALNERAMDALKAGQFERALFDLQRAVSITSAALTESPTSKPLRRDLSAMLANRGTAYSDLGRHDEAFRDFEEALRLSVTNESALTNRGNLLDKLGRYPEAVHEYDLVLEIKPKSATALFNRGSTKARMGLHEEALNDLNQAVNLEPHDARMLFNRAQVLERLGRTADALSDYELAESLDHDPKAAEAIQRLRAQDASASP